MKRYLCVKCGWIGTLDEMEEDYDFLGWEKISSDYVCPQCGTWHEGLYAYKEIEEDVKMSIKTLHKSDQIRVDWISQDLEYDINRNRIDVDLIRAYDSDGNRIDVDYDAFVNMCKKVLRISGEWPIIPTLESTIDPSQELAPFDLERAKAGDSVQTRDGRSVRILGFDIDNPVYTIAGVISVDGEDSLASWDNSGSYNKRKGHSRRDLFMAPKPTQIYWVNVYRSENVVHMGDTYLTEEEAVMLSEGVENYVTTISFTLPKTDELT